jgi:hypothetical protein
VRRFDDEDLTGAEFRECDLSRVRMVGVVMQHAEIDSLVTNVVVNGVEVMPYVEAELDRRHPVRLLLRSDQPEDLAAPRLSLDPPIRCGEEPSIGGAVDGGVSAEVCA